MLKLATAGIQDANPLEFLLRVMADTQLPLALRLDAAVTAAPFCHPKLRPVAHVGEAKAKSALDELLDEIDGKNRGIPNGSHAAIKAPHSLKNG